MVKKGNKENNNISNFLSLAGFKAKARLGVWVL
jgi:hypothetical protein